MTCDCRAKIEAKLTARLKEVAPEASEHKVELQGYGFGIGADNTLFMRPFMPYKTGAEYPLKKGGTKWKSKIGNMYFNFCPFCGERHDKPDAPGVMAADPSAPALDADDAAWARYWRGRAERAEAAAGVEAKNG